MKKTALETSALKYWETANCHPLPFPPNLKKMVAEKEIKIQANIYGISMQYLHYFPDI